MCRIPPKCKKPIDKQWTTRSCCADDFGHNHSIGIMAGPLSNGGRVGHSLVILDLDAADVIARADRSLPPTPMIDGRDGKPRSHRYYLTPNDTIPRHHVSTAEQAAPAAVAAAGHAGPAVAQFRRRGDNENLIDLKGTGGQCVCPPSRHGSGQRRVWDRGRVGEPAVVAFGELWSAVVTLAESCRGYQSAGGGRVGRERAGTGSPTKGLCNLNASTDYISHGVDGAAEPHLSAELTELVMQTLPYRVGVRNRQVLQLARALRDVMPAATEAELEPIVRVWWLACRRYVLTKDWDTTWADFRRAWPRVRVPMSQSRPLVAMRDAAAACDGPSIDKLRSMCVALAGMTGGAFALSCRTAGEILGVSHVHAKRLIDRLRAERFIHVEIRGDVSPTIRSAAWYGLGGDIDVPDFE